MQPSKIYDGTTRADVPALEMAGIVPGDEVLVTVLSAEFGDPHVGAGKLVRVRVQVSGADACNYAIPEEFELAADISPARIRIVAESVTKRVGEPDPPLTWRLVTGCLHAGDVLQGTLARAAGEAPGEHPIVQGTLHHPDYDIEFEPGVLCIL